MKVKDFCDMTMDNAKITILADIHGYEFVKYRLSKSELRRSKYYDKEISIIRTFTGMSRDEFAIMLEEE